MIVKNSYYLLLVLILLGLFSGCGDAPAGKSSNEAGNSKKPLVLFNWADYIGKNTLKNFEKETGIPVELITFDTEEGMIAAVQSDSDAYDIIVASDSTVHEFGMAKLLAKLDYSKIPNMANIGSEYLNPAWDSKQVYTVPFLYGTTGIVVNTNFVDPDEQSWKVLWNPKYKGKIAVLDELFEAISTANKYQGLSVNLTQETGLAKSFELLVEQKKNLHGYYTNEDIKEMMLSEEIWVGHMYSGEGLSLVDEDEKFNYFIPQEGAPLWFDSFLVLQSSNNKSAAYQFLNYLLRPDVGALIASELWYSTPNIAAEKLMDPEVLSSPAVYPPLEVRERCELFNNDLESSPIHHKMWADLKKTQI